jgi:hypothetical protein
MEIPIEEKLSVEKLANVFSNTTNSYKFYWFLAITNSIKKSNETIFKIENLVIEMIGEIWYPINYFQLSFGKQDQFSKGILGLISQFNIPLNIKKNELIDLIFENKENENVKFLINNLSRYVPFRFISSWFANDLRGILDVQKNQIISKLSIEKFNDIQGSALYKVDTVNIEINKYWHEYLKRHITILGSWAYWQLINYLQKNNPNVPGISEKLFAPQARNLSIAKSYWRDFLNTKGEFKCIYSNQIITSNNFSIDHFLPWSYVTHDQLWNLIPTSRSVNSSKGNNFPSLNYLDPFIIVQYDAIQAYLRIKSNSAKILLDYTILFKIEAQDFASISLENFSLIIKNNINPNYQIGRNMGFQSDWIY